MELSLVDEQVRQPPYSPQAVPPPLIGPADRFCFSSTPAITLFNHQLGVEFFVTVYLCLPPLRAPFSPPLRRFRSLFLTSDPLIPLHSPPFPSIPLHSSSP